MQFEMASGDLARAVGLVKGCVPTKTTLPILQHVLVSAADGAVTVRASNMDMEAEVRVPANVETPGERALPGEILHGIVRRFTKGETASITPEGNRAELVCGRSRYAIGALNGDEFPSMPNADGVSFSMPASTLVEVLSAVAYACDSNENRWHMCGVHVHVVDGKLIAVASDTHRLGWRSCPLPEGAEGMPAVTIPTRTVNQICTSLAGMDGPAAVTVSKTLLQVSAGDLVIKSLLIDAGFPAYSQFFDQAGEAAISLKPKTLGEAVDRAFVVYTGSDMKAPPVRIVSGQGGIELTAGAPNSAHHGAELVDADVHDRGAQFALNAKYLAEMLKHWPDVPVDLRVGAARAVVFTSADLPDMKHLIMTQIR